MTNIYAHQHGLVGDFRTELHSPEITAELGIHLADDVKEDAVVVLSNRAVCNELGDDR